MDQPLWYIIVVGFAVICFAFLVPKKKQADINQGQIVKEVESTLEHFMDEIEHDTEEMVQLVARMKQDFEVQQRVLEHRIEALDLRCQQLENQLQNQLQKPAYATLLQETGAPRESSVEAPAKEAEAPYVPAAIEPEHEPVNTSIKTRYAEVFLLYEEGKSIDMISKKTGIARGEIQLILQLSKREAERV